MRISLTVFCVACRAKAAGTDRRRPHPLRAAPNGCRSRQSPPPTGSESHRCPQSCLQTQPHQLLSPTHTRGRGPGPTQPVRDRQRRPPLAEPLQLCLDRALVRRVQRRRRLVEQQQRGVLEDHAGDRDPLLLAAREALAALADAGLVLVRDWADTTTSALRVMNEARRRLTGHDAVMDRGGPAGCDDLLL